MNFELDSNKRRKVKVARLEILRLISNDSGVDARLGVGNKYQFFYKNIKNV
jgi:hypothetical protein